MTLVARSDPGAGISVVIPAYNAGSYIAACLDSVIAQSSPPEEVIVVNDGSTDDTLQVARRYADRVKVVDKPNEGVSATRNRGATQAGGRWLMFLDADDVLVPRALELLLAGADDDCGVVYGGIVEFDESTGERWPRGGDNCSGNPPRPSLANFRRAMIVTPGCAIVRRALHCEIGGFEKPWQPTEDRDYWMKLGVLTAFRFVDEVVLNKRHHGAQSVRKYDQTLDWGMRVQLEFLDWLAERGIDAAYLDTTPETIVDESLYRALGERRWGALELMLETTGRLGLDSALRRRAARLMRIPAPLRGALLSTLLRFRRLARAASAR